MDGSVQPKVLPAYTHITGEIYDLIYAGQGKDYAAEATKLSEIIDAECESGSNRVLEAACGTGNYMEQLKDKFVIDGFDLSHDQVEAAQKKLPDLRIIQADMVSFDMGEQYDVVLCLFSSIGYLQTKENLDKAIANFFKHLKPGGLVIIEPWLKAEELISGHISLDTGANDHMSVARMGRLIREKEILTLLDLHHMVGTDSGIEHFVEHHTLAMYTDEDFADAYAKAGLEMHKDPGFNNRRGLYVGKKPL